MLLFEIVRKIDREVENYITELDPKFQGFWLRYASAEQESVLAILQFLRRLAVSNDASPTSVDVAIPIKELANLRKYVGSQAHKTLYRGIEVDDSSKYSVGGQFLVQNKSLTFWSDDVKWASAFVDWGINGIVVEHKFNPNEVLLDMHLVPYEIGQAGREDEILLKPGEYKSKIVQIF